MLTCDQITEFIMDYLDGALPTAQREHFEEHLPVCRACQDYLHSYTAAIRAGKAACKNSNAPPIPDALVRIILDSRKLG